MSKLVFSFPVALLVGALVAASPVWAMPRDGHGSGHWNEMDTDGDGKVSRAEFEDAASARFAAGDANGDGNLTKEEIRAAREARREKRADERFVAADKDGNGVLSRDEVMQRSLSRFDLIDKDKDGVISEKERADARKTMKERWREKRQER